jgi:predicted dehydrogenase
VSEPLRILVVGHGLIGRKRTAAVRKLAASRRVVLAGTVDPVCDDPSAETGAPHFRAFDEVPAGDYDAAVIAVPHDVATPTATSILDAGLPVLVEKPLGITVEEASALRTAAEGVGKPSFVGYNYRYLPAVSRLLEAVAADRLGRLRTLDLMIGHGGHPGSAEGWKLDPVRAGGGVLLDPGVHLLDLLQRLAPGATCSHVGATRGFWGTGIEEDVVATFEADHLLATVRISHIRWVNTFRIEAVGEDGYAIVEGRGGNYGPMTLRIGRRWAWADPDANGASQRETEEVYEFGAVDRSLDDEAAAVIDRWLDGTAAEASAVHPATMDEAHGVTALCAELYERLR